MRGLPRVDESFNYGIDMGVGFVAWVRLGYDLGGSVDVKGKCFG